jgi:hypothetical protein
MFTKLAAPVTVDFETLNSWESMQITHSTGARWNKDGDYFRESMLAHHEPCMPESVVGKTLILDGILKAFDHRCYCEHDCCGHIFSRVHSVRPLSGNRYLIVTTGGRNI